MILHTFLKILRKLYKKFSKKKASKGINIICDPEEASNIIIKLLESPDPCMIARYGSTELGTIFSFRDNKEKSVIGYIKGNCPKWWESKYFLNAIRVYSGFFPANETTLKRFCALMEEDSKYVDVLGIWQEFDHILAPKDCKFLDLKYLEPFWSKTPWTTALKDKKILVVHPFADSIQKQYENIEGIFKNPDILPVFKSFKVVRAIQSLGGECNQFHDWFEALDYMKNQIDSHDYDICLIGCGAYGFPLAAHVKRKGKKAIHIGGALQLIFGIRGKRWDSMPEYAPFINEKWIRASRSETPETSNDVEGGCYW